MKVLGLLIALATIPIAIYSQIASENKMKVRNAANYYLKKKIDPSPEFSTQYNSLFWGFQGYTKKDTLIAAKLIKRLYQVNDILFYRLMRIRLEWEFKQHLVKYPLDSIRHLLKKNIDSSQYYYMLGLYFRDSMTENLARRLGFVKVNSSGNEIVDWRIMKIKKWRNPKAIESPHGYILNDFKVDRHRDSAIFYYKIAIKNNPTEFHYLKELLLFMSNLPENKDEEVQQIITSKLENYTQEEKKWVKEYLDSLYKKN